MSHIVTKELILFLTVEGLKAFEALFGTKLKLESKEQGERGRRLQTASSAGKSIVFQKPTRACITLRSESGHLIGVDAYSKNEGAEYQMTVSCIFPPQGALQGIPPDVECRLLLIAKRFVSIEAFESGRSGSFTAVEGIVKYLVRASRFAAFREDYGLMRFFVGEDRAQAVPYLATTGMLKALFDQRLITKAQYAALLRTGNMADYEGTDKQGMQSPFADPAPSPEIVHVAPEDEAVDVDLDGIDDVLPTPEEPPSVDAADVELVAAPVSPNDRVKEIEEAQATAAAAMRAAQEPVISAAAQVRVAPLRAGSRVRSGRMQISRRHPTTGEIEVLEGDTAKVPKS